MSLSGGRQGRKKKLPAAGFRRLVVWLPFARRAAIRHSGRRRPRSSRAGFPRQQGAARNKPEEYATQVFIGSLYQYFPSKEALVAAVIERHAGELSRVAGDAQLRLGAALRLRPRIGRC